MDVPKQLNCHNKDWVKVHCGKYKPLEILHVHVLIACTYYMYCTCACKALVYLCACSAAFYIVPSLSLPLPFLSLSLPLPSFLLSSFYSQSYEGHFMLRRKSGSCIKQHIKLMPVKDSSGFVSHHVTIRRQLSSQEIRATMFNSGEGGRREGGSEGGREGG